MSDCIKEEIVMGDPIILDNAKGLQKYGLFKGCKGTCNSVTEVVGDKGYINFHPNGFTKFYWVDASRFILDEEEE
jgi:hypothetical protein